MITGAGIMFLAPKNEVLFLKRGDGGDYPGFWCFPGGTTEPGETAGETAVRETKEELGFMPPGDKRAFWTRRIAPRDAHVYHEGGLADQVHAQEGDNLPGEPGPNEVIDFTTFIQPVEKHFDPVVNGEHTGFAWAKASQPPEPLHPGARIALKRLQTDELELAEAIRDGELVSPYRYENISLVAMRITGTGTSYRKALKEYVYRDKDLYLNERFLKRCNGLTVILEHPTGNALNSKEFNDRVVGNILLPYIQGEEVWGIAKIYDDSARDMLEEETLSTSPAVIFRDPSVNEKVTLDDGSVLLIEGKPSLLDHLAICEKGVWDKGGEPTGVTSVTADDATAYKDSDPMTDEEKAAAQVAADKAKKDAEEKTRADADAGQKLDKLLSCMDSMTKRMDSFEEKISKKDGNPDPSLDDPEQVAADKAKKDAEAEEKAKADKAKKDAEGGEEEAKKKAAEEEGAKADKAKKDAEDMKARLDAVEKKIPEERSDDDMAEMADAQAKADSVASMFGKSAGRPLNGEGLLAYRKRQLKAFQAHSKDWKDVNLGILDATTLNIAERSIYADAMTAARTPTDLPVGTLREIRQADRTGRVISTFHGDMNAWMGDFKSPKRRLVGIVKDPR